MSAHPDADPRWRSTAQPGELPWTDEQPVVLVVDDEPLVRLLICSVVSRLGWRTLEAADGAEALAVGADSEIDLLITDYEMPGMDGIELADGFRDRAPDLPVVVVSGHETIGRIAGSRGYWFLPKPFDPGGLSSVITTLTLGGASAGAVRQDGPAGR
jgi:CheY-like chemotaxis protein